MVYCDWNNTSDINKIYHNIEWGVPVHDDRILFEFLILESFQCGLSWNIIINKRNILNLCFDNFQYDLIANYNENNIKQILDTNGMIKSKPKIEATIHNAKCFIKIRKEFGSFDKYIWKYSKFKTILYDKHNIGYIPTSNGLSDKISKDLKKRGFKFIGSTTIYSYLQAIGLINDHDKNCNRYDFINSNYPTVTKRRYLEKNIQHF